MDARRRWVGSYGVMEPYQLVRAHGEIAGVAFFYEGFIDVDVVGDDVGDVAAVAVGAVGVDEDIFFVVEQTFQCALCFLSLRAGEFHGVDAAQSEAFGDEYAGGELDAHFYGIAIDDFFEAGLIAVALSRGAFDGLQVAAGVSPDAGAVFVAVQSGGVGHVHDTESHVEQRRGLGVGAHQFGNMWGALAWGRWKGGPDVAILLKRERNQLLQCVPIELLADGLLLQPGPGVGVFYAEEHAVVTPRERGVHGVFGVQGGEFPHVAHGAGGRTLAIFLFEILAHGGHQSFSVVSGLLSALQNMVDLPSHAEIGTVFVALICVFCMQKGGFVDLTNILE